MKESTRIIYEELFQRYEKLGVCKEQILNAYNMLLSTYTQGYKAFVCGNGGSASDSEHIVGELMKSFKKSRKIDSETAQNLQDMGEQGEYVASLLEGALPTISLTSHVALSTAFLNDKEPTMTFAQQLYGLGNKGDTLIAISTSGNSKNCVNACILAKAKGINVVSLTGERQSKLKELSNVCVCVPEIETYKIQEYHLPIYHTLCAMLEEEIF